MAANADPALSNVSISPAPTEEEAAAVVAAITMAWPRPAIEETVVEQPTRWRFSGRWWNKPTWRRH